MSVMTTIAATILLATSHTAGAGLTLERFANTAHSGTPATTSILTALESVPTCEAGDAQYCSSHPHSFVLSGRYAPAAPARVGFTLSFDPPLPYPSPEAYARLWVHDHLLFPTNTTLGNKAGNAAPLWQNFPNRPLDNNGVISTTPGGGGGVDLAPGGYEIRVEYVCLANGCAHRRMTLRYSDFGSGDKPAILKPLPLLLPIPTSALLPTSGASEQARRAMYAAMERGWGTFDRPSSVSWVLLPESFILRASLYQISTGAYLPSVGITVHKATSGGSTEPDTVPPFVLRAGIHAIDNRYAEASLFWHGLNVSIEISSPAADSANLTVVATVLASPGGSSDDDSSSSSDFMLVLTGNFTNGRAGLTNVNSKASTITGDAAGLRSVTMQVVQGQAHRFPQSPLDPAVVLPVEYVGVALSRGTPVVLSTAPGSSHSATQALARTAAAREKEVAKLQTYGDEWRDVKDAVQTVLMWSTMFSPKRGGFITPSFGFTVDAMAPSPRNQVDGMSGEVIFEWDQSFVGYMFAEDLAGLSLALSNIIAVVKMRTVGGFIPAFGSGTFKTRGNTQPPVTSQALFQVAKRWGVKHVRWALDLCFGDLLTQNTWMYMQRRETPLHLITYGLSNYKSYAPDGTPGQASNGAGGESGLDNGPTVECAPFNETGLGLQDQYSSGQTGLYLMDTKALLGIAKLLGDQPKAVTELRRRFAELSTLAVKHLWNETSGLFPNRLSKTNEQINRIAPNQLYPLLAGPPGVSEAIATRAVQASLTNNAKFAVWPNATPPGDLPPVYARPIVQWWGKKSDSRGDGDTKGPHSVCCLLACNYQYAFGNFVQRTHGKIRYEGMALSRVSSDVEKVYAALEASPIPLYRYDCGIGLDNGSDTTLAPASWSGRATLSSPATCIRNSSVGPVWVLPKRVGPAAASLVELAMWHKAGDHYVVGSADGVTDAEANNYTKVLSLGFVWPPPGSKNASSRYGLPSLTKDDVDYISQDYWRGRVWAPMIQLVYWGLAQYDSPEVKAATDGLVAQSKALFLRPWFGYDSENEVSGTGRRVYENTDADTGEGYSYSGSAFPLYGWGALSGFIGLVHSGFYGVLNGTVAAANAL